jgi:APA family basic amino acid/polyamine antiporter
MSSKRSRRGARLTPPRPLSVLAEKRYPAWPVHAKPELIRAIGRWSLAALVINCIIGSGIFGLPSIIAGHLGRWAPLGYVVAAAAMAVVMACFAEVSSRFSAAGGPYLYARAAFGPFVGIQTGWLTWLTRIAANAAGANLFVIYLGELWPAAASSAPRIAILTAVAGVLTLINIRGVRQGAGMSSFFTVAKVLPLLVLIGAGAIFILRRGTAGGGGELRPEGLGDAMVLLVFAYGGFESAMIPLGEARDPRRDAPFALFTALAVCAVVYTLIQMVVMYTLPDPAAAERPLAAAARVVMGDAGAVLITAGALLSTLGAVSANMLNVPRLTFALAQEGEFPHLFGATHARFHTPHVSIAVYAVLFWGMAAAGSFRWAAVLSTAARLFTYAVVCAALPVLRRKQPGEERVRLPSGTAVAAAGVAFCAIVASRMGKAELAILLVVAAVATLNWWLIYRRRPAAAS